MEFDLCYLVLIGLYLWSKTVGGLMQLRITIPKIMLIGINEYTKAKLICGLLDPDVEVPFISNSMVRCNGVVGTTAMAVLDVNI